MKFRWAGWDPWGTLREKILNRLGWRQSAPGPKRRRDICATIALAMILCFGSPPLPSQERSKQTGSQSFLPSTTGDPLTLNPVDAPDVLCATMAWNNSGPKPTLALLCPPKEIFAPVRVYIKLSWLRPSDVPAYSKHISASPNWPTKLRTSKTAALVWLNVYEDGRKDPIPRWVGFNGVVDVALITERAKTQASRRP